MDLAALVQLGANVLAIAVFAAAVIARFAKLEATSRAFMEQDRVMHAQLNRQAEKNDEAHRRINERLTQIEITCAKTAQRAEDGC